MLDCLKWDYSTNPCLQPSLAQPGLHLAQEEYRFISFHSIPPAARHLQTPIRVRGLASKNRRQ